eukprot:NODE_394_length_2005_cov_63.596912_g387_i0.p1 GENE.NODE_394_length_2005_cov_63.596912_g387_i0~~NODE_394_length_2005_cov_63.596912_g387_i0.p1  ORF type:complete len:654 (-),score=263.74 NODE_394_length_2005_cov_63.596912_g387_i0:43-1851(-)
MTSTAKAIKEQKHDTDRLGVSVVELTNEALDLGNRVQLNSAKLDILAAKKFVTEDGLSAVARQVDSVKDQSTRAVEDVQNYFQELCDKNVADAATTRKRDLQRVSDLHSALEDVKNEVSLQSGSLTQAVEDMRVAADDRTEALQKKVDTTANDARALKASIQAVQNNHSQAMTEIRGLGDVQQNFDRSIADVRADISRVRGDVSSVQGKVEKHIATLHKVEGAQQETAHRLSNELQDSKIAQAEAVDEVRRRFEHRVKEVENVANNTERQLASQSSAGKGTEQQVEDLKKAVLALAEQTKQDNQTQSKAVNDALAHVKKCHAELEQRVSEQVQPEVTNLTAELADLHAALHACEDKTDQMVTNGRSATKLMKDCRAEQQRHVAMLEEKLASTKQELQDKLHGALDMQDRRLSTIDQLHTQQEEVHGVKASNMQSLAQRLSKLEAAHSQTEEDMASQRDALSRIGTSGASASTPSRSAAAPISTPAPRSTPAASGKPTLGLDVQKDEAGRGVCITRVSPNGAAERAGLRKGDVITMVDNDLIGDRDALGQKIKPRSPGDSLIIKYFRGSAPEQTCTLVLQAKQSASSTGASVASSDASPLPPR